MFAMDAMEEAMTCIERLIPDVVFVAALLPTVLILAAAALSLAGS